MGLLNWLLGRHNVPTASELAELAADRTEAEIVDQAGDRLRGLGRSEAIGYLRARFGEMLRHKIVSRLKELGHSLPRLADLAVEAAVATLARRVVKRPAAVPMSGSRRRAA